MRLFYIQHVSFENPGCILDWAKENKFNISSTHLYKGQRLPKVDDIDVLVIMGGPMAVYDDFNLPWLKDEKIFIESAIKKGKKVIGICFGAQLIADVLGSKVFPNKYKEIGWFPIQWKSEALVRDTFSTQSKELTVFHWHGDTFDCPKDSIHLAYSLACLNQAFQYGDNVYAFQFHLEVKSENILAMLKNCGDELIDAPYIQSRQEIVENIKLCDMLNDNIFSLLSRIVAENNLS